MGRYFLTMAVIASALLLAAVTSMAGEGPANDGTVSVLVDSGVRESVGCHGADVDAGDSRQGCHGEKDAVGCHGSRGSRALLPQRRADRLQARADRREAARTSRTETRASRKASGSCHGESRGCHGE